MFAAFKTVVRVTWMIVVSIALVFVTFVMSTLVGYGGTVLFESIHNEFEPTTAVAWKHYAETMTGVLWTGVILLGVMLNHCIAQYRQRRKADA